MRIRNRPDVVAARARRTGGRFAGLAVEAMESRRLLTAFWTGAAGNNWSDSGNWQGGITPQSDGVVDFPANAANKTSEAMVHPRRV